MIDFCIKNWIEVLATVLAIIGITIKKWLDRKHKKDGENSQKNLVEQKV